MRAIIVYYKLYEQKHGGGQLPPEWEFVTARLKPLGIIGAQLTALFHFFSFVPYTNFSVL